MECGFASAGDAASLRSFSPYHNRKRRGKQLSIAYKLLNSKLPAVSRVVIVVSLATFARRYAQHIRELNQHLFSTLWKSRRRTYLCFPYLVRCVHTRLDMVPQQNVESTRSDSPTSSGVPLFGSQLIDKNSATPYSDATQVGLVDFFVFYKKRVCGPKSVSSCRLKVIVCWFRDVIGFFESMKVLKKNKPNSSARQIATSSVLEAFEK